MAARTGQKGWDRQTWIDRTGSEEQDRQNRTGQQNKTAMTERPGQAVRIGLPAQDCKDKTARAEVKGENSMKRIQNKTPSAGQPEWDRQDIQ
jgi:hypothetical protein